MDGYRLLLGDLARRLSWRFPLLVAWTALVGISESASIVLLLPLLDRAGVATGVNQGAVTRLINEGLTLIGANSTVEILLVVGVVATIQVFLAVGLNWWTVVLARNYQSRRQLELFGAFMRAKWVFITDRKAGEMTNVIITECERLGRAFIICLTLLGSAIVAVIYMVLSALVAWQATLILICFAAVAGLAMIRLYKKSYEVGGSLAPLNAQLQVQLDEQFSGVKFIKASAGIDHAMAQVEPLVRKLGEANAFASAMPGTVRSVLEYFALIGLATVLVLASKGLGVAPASVIIVLALFGRLFPRVTTVQAQLHHLNGYVQAIAAIDNLQAAAEAECERQDSSSEPLKIERPAVLTVCNLQVKFGERVVLDQINLTLRIPGALAIVGSSGAGKSTLVHTLLGLLEPSAGSIRLGTHDFRSAPLGAWRRTIGFVPQETMLFHASIWENLTLANPAASAAQVKLAARRAHAHDFIAALPEGFDTIIGDQGVKLSGGQRQRLAIARALLTNPTLLLMDEAMSALDAESEAELLRTLDELRQQMGILIIAHRLATVRTADSICVIEGGRVVETGTWSELMARRTRLYTLAESQSFADDRSLAAT